MAEKADRRSSSRMLNDDTVGAGSVWSRPQRQDSCEGRDKNASINDRLERPSLQSLSLKLLPIIHARKMELLFSLQSVLLPLSVIGITIVWKLFVSLLWRPLAIQKSLEKQGVKCQPYNFLRGCLKEMKSMNEEARRKPMADFSHDIAFRVLPSYHKWIKQHGETFLYWFGHEPRLVVSDADMIRDILSTKFGFFTKTSARPSIMALLGKGLVLVTGENWVKHRRVVNPAFHVDKLKGMNERMAACTLSMLDGWKREIKEVEVHGELKTLTANIIALTAFGSSYAEGKEVFRAQDELSRLASMTLTDIYFPGLQYLPTKTNRRVWALEKKIKDALKRIINSRINSAENKGSFGDDLLGMMMESSKLDQGSSKGHRIKLSLSMDDIINECNTFFFAGHETTSNLLTWAMFLLCIYPEWQKQLREEALAVCRTEIPDADMLGKLKLTTMFILETLRLYGPVTQMLRKTTKDIKVGNMVIPKNVSIAMPLLMVHRKKEYWGEDANEFNPFRFSQGASKAAKHPNAMMPFSIGPRTCIGQNFAMMESKLVLVMILHRFTFSLSHNYKHAPILNMTLQPQFGLPILLEPLYM